MILDQPEKFAELDPEDMLGYIEALPAQLEEAWQLGAEAALPTRNEFTNVVIAGMGGSAIGGDLLAAYATPLSKIPIVIWRNYDMPAFVGPESLVIASSHSGNTEETLSAFDRAAAAGATVMAVTTGGQLAERAEAAGVPTWRFVHDGQPRSAVGFSFGLLLAALNRLELIEFEAADLWAAGQAMREQMGSIGAHVPVANNHAKRMAGQLMDRWPTIIGADFLAPVARRWRTQLAEVSKALAQFEELPEADHNMLAGIDNPKHMFGPTMVVFLRSSLYHPRNLRRVSATRKIMMLEGFNTDVMQALGESRLAHQWTCLHLGDYVSYFLAMTYAADPTPVPTLVELKSKLAQK